MGLYSGELAGVVAEEGGSSILMDLGSNQEK